MRSKSIHIYGTESELQRLANKLPEGHLVRTELLWLLDQKFHSEANVNLNNMRTTSDDLARARGDL